MAAAPAAAELEGRLAPGRGRRRALGVRALLAACVQACAEGPFSLRRVTAVLNGDRAGFGLAAPVTYRQVEYLFGRLLSAVDPAPVPRRRPGEDPDAWAARREAARPPDAEERAARRERLCDDLLEAGVPAHLRAHGSVALDWTDAPAWARGARRGRPPADPDAGWGRRPAKGPGPRDERYFGYEEHVAVLVADEGGAPVPELVRRTALVRPAQRSAEVGLGLLARLGAAGVPGGDVVADAGYAYARAFCAGARRLGWAPVVDLHPADRGPAGTAQGAVVVEGELYCPAMPPGLVRPGPGVESASLAEARAPWRLRAKGRPDPDGYQRLACPAGTGLRCPLRPESLALPRSRPTVTAPPAEPGPCCRQRSVTVSPAERGKVWQKHPWGSAAWRASYARRGAAERAFARAKDRDATALAYPAARMMGLTRHRLVRTFAWCAHNLRVLAAFARRDQTAAVARPQPVRRRGRLADLVAGVVVPGPAG